MKMDKLICRFIQELDLFKKRPNLYFKGKLQKPSKFGKALIYLYIAIYIAFFLYKIIRMSKKIDITYYESFDYSGIPNINLTNDLFYAAFSFNYKIDSSYYYPLVFYYEEVRENGKMVQKEFKNLDLEICQLEKFGKKYRELLKNKDLDNLYCIKNLDKTALENSKNSNKYLWIAFMPCIYQAPDGTKCHSQSEVMRYFAEGVRSVIYFADVELTPCLFYTPTQTQEKEFHYSLFQTLYNQFLINMKLVIIETDKDTLGFSGFYINSEIKKFLK